MYHGKRRIIYDGNNYVIEGDISFTKEELEESEKAANEMFNKLNKNMVDLDPKISKLLDENFWDLI